MTHALFGRHSLPDTFLLLEILPIFLVVAPCILDRLAEIRINYLCSDPKIYHALLNVWSGSKLLSSYISTKLGSMSEEPRLSR